MTNLSLKVLNNAIEHTTRIAGEASIENRIMKRGHNNQSGRILCNQYNNKLESMSTRVIKEFVRYIEKLLNIYIQKKI